MLIGSSAQINDCTDWSTQGGSGCLDPSCDCSQEYGKRPFCLTCLRLAAWQVVVVGHMRFESPLRRDLRVTRHELLVPPVNGKIEWIARIAVDELEIRLRHRQFAER